MTCWAGRWRSGLSKLQQVNKLISVPVCLAAGHACVVLGTAGLFVPLLPTTPFLLLAVYFYSRSSKKFHDWILHHPRFGRPLQDWRKNGIIRPGAKLLAVSALAASILGTIAYYPLPPAAQAGLAALALAIAVFLLSRPSR